MAGISITPIPSLLGRKSITRSHEMIRISFETALKAVPTSFYRGNCCWMSLDSIECSNILLWTSTVIRHNVRVSTRRRVVCRSHDAFLSGFRGWFITIKSSEITTGGWGRGQYSSHTEDLRRRRRPTMPCSSMREICWHRKCRPRGKSTLSFRPRGPTGSPLSLLATVAYREHRTNVVTLYGVITAPLSISTFVSVCCCLQNLKIFPHSRGLSSKPNVSCESDENGGTLIVFPL